MQLEQKRRILERLAEGEISLEEAEAALDAGDDPLEGPEASMDDMVALVANLSGGALIEVIGETDIETPAVDGPCNASIRRRGDVIRVDANGASEDFALYVPSAAPLNAMISCADGEVTGLTGPFSVSFNVGDARLEAAVTRGESTIKANCGDLSICLDSASDVRVAVEASASVDAGPDFEKVGRGEWRYGEGRASLVIRGNLGLIELTTT